MSTIGERIRMFRKMSNMTQAQLAEKIGVSRVTVTQYENGSITPPLKMIEKLEDALDTFLIVHPETAQSEYEKEQAEQQRKNIDYISRLRVPALKLNDTGRDLLLNDAEKYAKIKELTE